MKTKYLVRFLNRAARFDVDIEIVDALALAVRRGLLNAPMGGYVLSTVSRKQHPRLAAQLVSDQNRLLNMTHLKSTVHSSYLKDLYEDVSAYLAELLIGATRNGLAPKRLIGGHAMSFEANQLLDCNSIDDVCRLVSDALFRKLEQERSTIKLLTSLNAKLDLCVPERVIQDSLPYLEIRHLLVHRDGVADQSYCDRFPSMMFLPGKKIRLSHGLVRSARERITVLVESFDSCAVARAVVPGADLRP
jgi:hypothetical protein